MNRLGKGLLFVVCFLAIGACVPATPVPIPSPRAIASVMATQTATPVTTSTPSPVPTATHVAASATPFPLLNLCSPLQVTPWSDLWKIDWQAFKMPSHYDGTKFRDNGHPGVDLVYYSRYGRPSIMGEGVQSVTDGKIAAVIKDRNPYGNMVMTETSYDQIPTVLLALVPIPKGDSLYTVYAHLRDPVTLELGDPVKCGQALGHVGMSGMATGPHLHLEMRWGPPNTEFPVMAYYTADYTDEELRDYVLWRMSGIFVPFDPMILLSLKLPSGSPGSNSGSGQ